jgi:D-sedoheptulose 7-phosphate isomerase
MSKEKKQDLFSSIVNSCDVIFKLSELEPTVSKAVNVISNKLANKGKIFLCGNGGSYSDAEHICSELLIRLRPHFNRDPIPAILLGQNMSTLTACSNDYDFKYVFSKNLRALGATNKKDILIAYSTSGNSLNIIEVLKLAKKMNIFSICLLGKNGGKAAKISNLNLIIPSNNTARIQEAHIFLSHYIFEEVEKNIFKKI